MSNVQFSADLLKRLEDENTEKRKNYNEFRAFKEGLEQNGLKDEFLAVVCATVKAGASSVYEKLLANGLAAVFEREGATDVVLKALRYIQSRRAFIWFLEAEIERPN